MKFDDILYKYVGTYGKYQIAVAAILYVGAFLGSDVFLQIFISGSTQFYWCFVPGLEHLPLDWKLWFSHPLNELETDYIYCEVYDLDYTQYDWRDFIVWDRDAMTPNGTKTRECDYWHFDMTNFEETLRTEWTLTCDDDQATLPLSMWLFGLYLGAYILGEVSDRYGRKPVIYLSYLVKMLAGMIGAFSPGLAFYTTMQFIGGFASGGAYMTGYILVCEMLHPKRVSIFGSLYHASAALGVAFYSALAYQFRDWRTLTKVAYALWLPLFLGAIVVPESPRWLVREKKRTAAVNVLTRIAKWNGREVPENLKEIVDEVIEDEIKTRDGRTWRQWCWHGYRSSTLRWTTFAIHYFWYIMSYVWYIMALGLVLEFADVYLHAGLTHGLFELPAILIGALCMEFSPMGRKMTTAWAMLGACLVAVTKYSVVIYEYITVWYVLSYIGKGLYTICFLSIWQMSFEFFPTESRNAGMGFGTLMARSGGTYSYLMAQPLHEPWVLLPVVVFGAIAVFGGVVMLFYGAETQGHQIPTVWEEVKDWKAKEFGIPSGKTLDRQAKKAGGGDPEAAEKMNGMNGIDNNAYRMSYVETKPDETAESKSNDLTLTFEEDEETVADTGVDAQY